MTPRLFQILSIAAVALAVFPGQAQRVSPSARTSRQDALLQRRSPIAEPYAYVGGGAFGGPAVPESPDPLVSYRWGRPQASDALQIFVLEPRSVSADPAASFDNLASLTGPMPGVVVRGTGSIRIDFGVELAAWIEFDSPDAAGAIEMSISEYNEPGHDKTRVPVKHGDTWRLELNGELYDGVRFAWIHVKSLDRPWHIKGIRAVCQVKPANYAGRFASDDSLLTKVWYASAYSVKASLAQDYFGSILMDRGDRISWTGDAHPSQAAALVAFANYDFIKRNIDSTAKQSNGIRSYSLYWVSSLLDYYAYTGDAATLAAYIPNACAKLDEAYAVFGTDPKLRFYGWDERLTAGFEIWFKPGPEAQRAYSLLAIRAWREFAAAMTQFGRPDLADKYAGYARTRMELVRKDANWIASLGLHAAADAVNTGLLTAGEQTALYDKEFRDRVNRISLSPFNQYFILQALARLGKHDDALSTVRDMWGGMIRYGGTTTFEVYRPSWNAFLGTNDAVPNAQCGIVSLCHPWGAGPVKWLNEEVLGIVPTSPGFATYDVFPHPGRTLTRVEGTTPTPRGDIRVRMDVASGGGFVAAPAGTVGRIGIPEVGKTIRRILVNGRLAWDGEFHPVPGIAGAAQDAEFVTFTSVRPGEYAFATSYRGETPAYREAPEEYAARFVKLDTATSGSWGGVYGRDGYVLSNYDLEGRDKMSWPSYVTSLEYFRAFPKSGLPDAKTWATATSDTRALSPDRSNAGPRNATGFSNSDQTMTLTIGIKGAQPYHVALYFVDWEADGRRMAVEMFDADTLKMIAPVKLVSRFSGGAYLVYAYDRSAKFRINKVRGATVTLSGIFFDAALDGTRRRTARGLIAAYRLPGLTTMSPTTFLAPAVTSTR